MIHDCYEESFLKKNAKRYHFRYCLSFFLIKILILSNEISRSEKKLVK